MRFDDIVAHGNRGFHKHPVTGSAAAAETNRITCTDGFTLSVIAGAGTYSTPTPALCSCAFGIPADKDLRDEGEAPHDYPGPYTAVEVGYPSARPEPWTTWEQYAETPASPTRSVYCYVPIDTVRDLITSHGGEQG